MVTASLPEARFALVRDRVMEGVAELLTAGVDGQLPATGAAAGALVRRVFPGFDAIAPVIRELLVAPGGRLARLSDKAERQRAFTGVVKHEAPGLGRHAERHVAAALQLLTAAATSQALPH